MAYKDPLDERNRAARRRHYEKNREQYYERNRKKQAEIRAYMNELKSVPCMDCGVSYPPYVMDFDHREGVEKLCNPHRLINVGTWKRVKEELAKCDVVCSNCHRERTHGRLRTTVPGGLLASHPDSDSGLLRFDS